MTQLAAEPRDQLLRELARLVVEREAAGVVIGFPINMDGSEGPSAKRVRAFAAEVAAAIEVPIALQDERRTSLDADRRLARSGYTHGQKKARRDAIAAAAILEAYLERWQRALGSSS